MLFSLLELLKDKAYSERAVLVGLVAGVLIKLAATLDIVIDQAALEVVLLPVVTGVVTRVFVTSKGVTPGI